MFVIEAVELEQSTFARLTVVLLSVLHVHLLLCLTQNTSLFVRPCIVLIVFCMK